MRAHDDTADPSGSGQGTNTDQLSMAADVLGLLADTTRLHLLRLLAAGEQDVNTLTTQVAASRSSVSQHLGRLRLAGLVQARRDGRRMFYHITSDHLPALVEEALGFADHIVRGIPHHDDTATLAAGVVGRDP